MDLPGPGRLALALLLASTAVAAAFLYGEGLHGAERHAYAGTWGSRGDDGNETLLLYPYDDARPGDILRLEQDTAARYPYPLDLYVVPMGEGLQVPNGTARVLLHVPFVPTGERIVGPDGMGESNTTRNVTFRIYPDDSDVVRHINKQVRIPAGVHGVDLVWHNATTPPPGKDGGITVVITRAEGLWLAMEPYFLGLQAALLLGTLAALVPWRRRPEPAPPTGPPGLPDVAALFTAAGDHLRQLRNTMAAAGLFLLVAILLGRQLLWRLLQDRVGVWAPATEEVVQASYLVASAAVVAAWALMAWRVQRQLRAWRRHEAQNPLA